MKIKAGKLYIMSGLPGSGKSKILKRSIEKSNLTQEMILSSDKIRKSVVGKLFTFKGGKVKNRIHEGDHAIFEILEKMLQEKAKEKLTVFIDATSVTDKDRGIYVRLAESYGLESEILILNTSKEECIQNDLNREVSVGESIISKSDSRFERTSKYPYKIISNDTIFELIPSYQLEKDKIDIISDIHGLYDQFEELISKQGYTIENGIPVHKEGRKILFLGDFIDRGPDSVKMLNLVMNSVQSGKHYAISGNHEVKLLANLQKDPKEAKGSFAVMSTYVEVLQQIKNKDRVIKFLKSLPGYYIYKDIVFAHANIGYFDFRTTPFTELIYGSYKETIDSDKEYQILYDKKINSHTLIRGHILETSKQENVFSLEMGGCENGKIALLPLDKFISKGKGRKAFESSVITIETKFNYKELLNNTMLSKFRTLEKDKLVKATFNEAGLLKLYKYSQSVFYKNQWNQGGENLLKARGIVVDLSGKIIQHPFDKIFNYKENGAGENIKDDQIVQYVQKLNGFLGNIGLDPFTKELLITTTGSFDSDFVGYIKDFIDKELEIKLKRFFAKNKVTLSFEVIHSEDPHIIKYSDDMIGLHLIGVRGLNLKDKNWKEEEVDEVAKELGFRRPFHGIKTFGEVKKWLKTFKDEGFMIRDPKTNNFIMKMKSPYYLTAKFIGRMNEGKIKFLFANPEKFKEKIGDEEFFVLVDLIIRKTTKEEFIKMNQNKRIEFVRNLINDILK